MYHLINCEGRINRKLYIINFFKIIWFLFLLLIILSLVIDFLSLVIDFNYWILYFILIIFIYLMFINFWKRLHDINKPAWIWFLIILWMTWTITLWTIKLSIQPIYELLTIIWIPELYSSIISGIFAFISIVFWLILLFKKWSVGDNIYWVNPLTKTNNEKEKLIIKNDTKIDEKIITEEIV